MSIQIVPSLPPLAEPAQVRPRVAAPDAEGEREDFTLPEEPVEAPAPVAARTETPRRDAQAPVSSAGQPASAASRSKDGPPKTESRQPAQQGAIQSTSAPQPDASALFALAVAAQGGAATPATAEGEAAAPKEGEEAVTAGPSAAAGSPADLLAIAVAAVPDAASAAAPAPDAALSAALLAAASGTGAATVPVVAATPIPRLASPVAVPGEAGVATAAAVTPAAAGLVKAAGVAARAGAAGTGAPQASALALPEAAAAASDTTEAAASGTATKPLAGFAAVFAQAGAAPAEAPGSGQAAPETKPGDVLQPAFAAIDVLATTTPTLGRPEAAAGVTGPDTAAVTQQADGKAQGQPVGQPTPLHVLPIEIGLRVLAGARKFDIRLDPAELGRVDVKLEISDKGEVTAKLVVDRVETLHLLQRDARTLERAFEQAGLKPSDAGVDITLRDPSDQSGFRQQRQQDDAPRRPRRADLPDDLGIPEDTSSIRRLVRLGGVDLSI